MDEDDLRALLAAQTQQIAALTAAVSAQATAFASLAAKPEVGTDLTVAALRDLYEEAVACLAASRSVRSSLGPWVARFGPRPAMSLRPAELALFRDERGKETTNRGALRAPRTLNEEVNQFKIMLNWGVSAGLMARHAVTPFKKLAVEARETTIDRGDEEAVMEEANPVMGAMFLLGVDAGMRLNEIRLLERQWVDLAGFSISLPAWVTKTRVARKLRITERIVDALREQPQLLGSTLYFPNPATGRPYSKQCIGRWWRDLRAEVGLKPAGADSAVVFHATRHTAATRIERVAGLKASMKQLGQTSVEVALRYLHAHDDDMEAMRVQLDELAKQSRRPPQSVHTDATPLPEEKQGGGRKIG